MEPKDREKRWLKKKGYRNVARMWREDFKMWVIVPMYPDREFKYVLPEFKPTKVMLKKKK